MTQAQRLFAICFLLSFSVAFTLIMQTDPAWAQTTVDVRPLANDALTWIASALGTAATVLVGFGIRFVSSKIGLANSDFEASLNQRLNDIIHNGIQYAYVTAQNEVNKPGSGLEAVKIDNIFMGWALQYVVSSAPGIIKQFSLSEQRLADMIKARLTAYTASVPVSGGLASPAPAADVIF